MMNKKHLKIYTASFLALLSLIKPLSNLNAADVETITNLDFLWNPYYAVLNEDAPFNPGNLLQRENLINRAKISLWFGIYFGQVLEMNGNFEIEVDSTKSQNIIENTSTGIDVSTIKDAKVGFEQLYLQWYLSEDWFMGFGKIPVRNGFSRVYAPMNYNSRSSDFRSHEGQWNAWLSGSKGNWSYSLRYFPVIEFQDQPNAQNQTERFFSWLETSIKRQTFSLESSYFFYDSLETKLIFFVQEREVYTFRDVYYAAGLGFSWPVLENLTFRGEILTGNGFDDLQYIEKTSALIPQLPQYRYVEPNLESLAVKVLGGFTVLMPWNVEVSFEYFYNGAGYSDNERKKVIDAALESQKYYEDSNLQLAGAHKAFLGQGWPNWSIYDIGRHYLFLQFLRRNIADSLNFLNSSILLLSDMSFYNSTELDFIINDNLTFGAKFNFFLFPKEGAFSLTPNQLETVLSLKCSI